MEHESKHIPVTLSAKPRLFLAWYRNSECVRCLELHCKIYMQELQLLFARAI
ncbi:hypothetical protein Syun_007919 [Stephania yunnanensis]|uniref:Uncharacterized protein n=1 Tax=Stephania yunnanensis TaxID=152371 RepID=A0AAP0KZE0_9MAGN